jgi:hypothetical protein
MAAIQAMSMLMVFLMHLNLLKVVWVLCYRRNLSRQTRDSLKLDGLEKDVSNARERAVIIHGADYVSESFIQNNKDWEVWVVNTLSREKNNIP